MNNTEIAKFLGITEKHVTQIRKRFVEEGLESAINRKPLSRTKPRKLDGEAEARLIAIACDAPPEGRSRWTLTLLANKLVELEVVEKISATTVGITLKKTNLNRG
jgi:transposase